MNAIPERLRDDWDDVLRPTREAQPFDPAMAAPLPATVRRWLDHAIAPGTPLRRRVGMRQHGEIKLGDRWWPFTALQALDPLQGFVWPVTARMFGLPVKGFDRFSRGSGEMRHRLLGLVTVAHGSGPDFDRSAAARAATEICWMPAAALDPVIRWREVSDSQVIAVVPLAGYDHEVTLTITGTGAVQSVTVPRWTSLDGGPYRLHTFGARVLQEATFDGFTVPAKLTAGYGDGDSYWRHGAFIRLTVESAAYR
ncbi:MAG TPA: DUF6544 family protein [Pilimelia sp.]|nr:DUF6544 family protein [Pilimelia sp.]